MGTGGEGGEVKGAEAGDIETRFGTILSFHSKIQRVQKPYFWHSRDVCVYSTLYCLNNTERYALGIFVSRNDTADTTLRFYFFKAASSVKIKNKIKNP